MTLKIIMHCGEQPLAGNRHAIRANFTKANQVTAVEALSTDMLLLFIYYSAKKCTQLAATLRFSIKTNLYTTVALPAFRTNYRYSTVVILYTFLFVSR